MFKLKDKLFIIKKAVARLFVYPKQHIEILPTYDKYWKSKRGENIGSLSDWQKDRADILLKNINGGNLSILDLGCGDGAILKHICENNKNVKTTYGVDFSDFSLSQAGKFGIKTFKNDISKIENFDFLKEEVDYILLLEVIEHIQNSEKLVNLAFEKSEKGVFISVPNTGYFLHRLRLLFGRFPLQWREHPSEHVRFWTKKDMKWWLSALGYKNYKIFSYKGVPVFNKIFPSLFSAGILVFVKKDSKNKKSRN